MRVPGQPVRDGRAECNHGRGQWAAVHPGCTGQGRGRPIERASNTDGIWFAYASGWGVRLEEESEYGCGRVGVALGRGVVGVSNDAALHNATQGWQGRAGGWLTMGSDPGSCSL